MNPIEALTPADDKVVTIIFAVNTNLSQEEELALVRKELQPSLVKQVKGCCKDLIEDAYVIATRDTEVLEKVVSLCWLHGQESILILDSERNAELYYTATQIRESIGSFVPVYPNEAIQSGDWTLDGQQFYKVK